MTKCGRYGLTKAEFDYSPVTIRASVNRSLSRLNTTYLDAVYLHDIEFVSEQVQPRGAGHHALALSTEAVAYGLAPGDEAKIRGPGDQVILDAVAELRKMKQEGLVKHIGITGELLAASTLACAYTDNVKRLSTSYPSTYRYSRSQHCAIPTS